MSTIAVLALAAVGLAAAMTFAWAVALATGRSGWIDGIWSLSVGLTGAAAALVPDPSGDPSQWRHWLVAALAAIWGLRLGGHIVWRTRGAPDDPRYARMKQEWGADAPRQLFLFLQAQAIAGLVLVAAITLTARGSGPLGLADVSGLLIYALGVVGAAAADAQLARFRSDPANQGGICDVGLWRWSRHPNYFFEWLGWCAYPVIAFGSAGALASAIALLAPLMMYWLLVRVSGIPPLEQHMLASRGQAFAEYQALTSAFWPRPPR